MRVAVTGCASDFATAILPRLASDPEIEEVVGIDRREPRAPHEKLRFEQEDVRSSRLETLFAGCDAVIHLAFVVREIKDKALTHEVNIGGSRNVVESASAAGVRRLVIASSVSAYGSHPDHPRPVDESVPVRGNPDLYYFHDKAEVERFVERWRDDNVDDPLEIALLRPVVIFGAGFANPVIELLTGPLAPVPRAGLEFQLLPGDEMADAFHRLAKGGPTGPFNLAPDDHATIAELAEIHGQRIVKVPAAVARPALDAGFALGLTGGSREWLAEHQAVVSSGRLQRETGWRPSMTTREAAHALLLQHGRPILRSRGELHRREVAEAALAPATAAMRRWSDVVPAMREATGGPEGFDAILEQLEHDFLPFRTGEVHLEVHTGDTGAPAIVFSHGLGDHSRFLTAASGGLRERGFNVVAMDRPGHGITQGRRGDAPFEASLDVIEATVRYARERFGGPVALAGASLGGILSWYALTRELDVEGAVCQNIAHPDVHDVAEVRYQRPFLRGLARTAPRAPIRGKQLADYKAMTRDPNIDAYFADEQDPLRCTSATARSISSFFEFEPRRDWSELSTPALVIVGSDDGAVTADFTRRAFERSAHPHAKLEVLPGVSHMLFHEHLPLGIETIAGFVSAQLGSPTAA
ncbi:MAG: alpha/beta fold hydrolase [Thermoleophilaceae bacterium]